MKVIENEIAPTDTVFGFREVGYEEYEFVETFEELKSLIDRKGLDKFVVKIIDKSKRINAVMSGSCYFSARTRSRHPSLSGIKHMLDSLG